MAQDTFARSLAISAQDEVLEIKDKVDGLKEVSGTHDSTNWTSLTIDDETFNIGGGSGSVEVDNETIIVDPDTGKIKTSLGGYKEPVTMNYCFADLNVSNTEPIYYYGCFRSKKINKEAFLNGITVGNSYRINIRGSLPYSFMYRYTDEEFIIPVADRDPELDPEDAQYRYYANWIITDKTGTYADNTLEINGTFVYVDYYSGEYEYNLRVHYTGGAYVFEITDPEGGDVSFADDFPYIVYLGLSGTDDLKTYCVESESNIMHYIDYNSIDPDVRYTDFRIDFMKSKVNNSGKQSVTFNYDEDTLTEKELGDGEWALATRLPAPPDDNGDYALRNTDGEYSWTEAGSSSEPDAYIKSASVSGNTLTLTNKDDTTVEFTPEGGGSDDTIYIDKTIARTGSSATASLEFTDSSLTEEQYNAIWSDNPEKVVFRITLAVGSGYSYLNFEFKYSGTHYARNYICPALNNAIKVSLGELYTLGTLAIQITPDQTSKYKCTTALAHVADIYESYKFPTGNYNKGLVDFTIAASKAGAEQYGYDTTLLTRKAVKEYLADSSMPAAPTSDGNYVLKCSIVDGVATYNWVAE